MMPKCGTAEQCGGCELSDVSLGVVGKTHVAGVVGEVLFMRAGLKASGSELFHHEEVELLHDLWLVPGMSRTTIDKVKAVIERKSSGACVEQKDYFNRENRILTDAELNE